ncbi:sigma 54-interacting transcriptional regulator [Microaerobacter geothermalis]|uniref:sigma-54 interaction domain-containing protein n=1 Tax=Microaerobacter geothermalis TaxID=674972 RepID=UPI001F4569C7|nr:sigma 54-interacting transcriptional regulator [Microaerobacter geothermalis]MCF6092574.1 sigma 54-interacting transcriptional regulator [Microaerobacter geothermalis]
MEINQEILESIINTAYEWIVVVDADARIVMMNDAYCKFLEVTREEVIGKPVQDVIENTRMHIVVNTGKEEIADVQRIRGNDMIANRFPIRKDGKIIGAVGSVMFRTTKELNALTERVRRLSMELEYYQNELQRESTAKYRLEHIVGQSSKILELKNLALKAAKSHSTILLIGESGTGKELFAHAIHHASPRSRKPFIKINCAAIPESLLESELFGYVEGAFTGAKKGGKPGKFELANEGTIFLDEIGDMPINMQTKLLRILQEMEVERIAGHAPIPIDVRVIAATNAPLEELVKKDQFRQDLYYRLHVFRLDIPPLRERKEDIPLLISKLLEKLNFEFGKWVTKIDDEAMKILYQHDWPGNVRELENVLERALNIVESSVIGIEHLPLYLKKDKRIHAPSHELNLKKVLAQVEKETIKRALNAANQDRYKAADLLGISKTTLYDKINKYGI